MECNHEKIKLVEFYIKGTANKKIILLNVKNVCRELEEEILH